ncbi:MAG TPA: glycosyltransferase [Hyphomicrobiaceae bacterium]
MANLLLSTAWAVLIGWLIWRAARQQHALDPVAPMPTGRPSAQTVAVIVPARDESANIGPCIESLLDQEGMRGRLRVIAVDDRSSDRTAAVVESLARRDERIRFLRAPSLPTGWRGKPHACCIGAAAAPSADWLCFLDADMRARPLLIASAMDSAVRADADLLSLAPRHDLCSFAERLLIPCGLYVLAFTQDLARIQSADSRAVAATGQFMLVRSAAYRDVGGHSAVRSKICEDLELARLLKQRGYRVLLQDGSSLLSTRMYTGWSTLWPGFAKNLTDMLGGPLRTLVTAIAAPVVAWTTVALPLIDLAACQSGSPWACIAFLPATLALAAALGIHTAGAMHFRIPLWYGLLFPVGYTVGAAIALDGLRWRALGRVRWKGRTYHV